MSSDEREDKASQQSSSEDYEDTYEVDERG